MNLSYFMKFILVSAFLFCFSIGSLAQEGNSLSLDALHYQKTKSPLHDMMYSQMWYFNFVDDENHIAGVLGAGVLNPQQRVLPIGQTSAMVALLRDEKEGPSFYTWSPHYDPKDVKNFSASSTFEPSAEAPYLTQFRNPALSVRVGTKNFEYQINSLIADKTRTVIAKLTYVRVDDGLGAPWLPWSNIQLPKMFGVIGGHASYTMAMPNARVSGTIEVIEDVQGKTSDKTYVIHNARGYHDGYFGSATLIPVFKWDWLSYQQDNMAIQMIAPHGPEYKCVHSKKSCLPGNLRVLTKTSKGVEVAEFSKSQIKLNYDVMKVDPEYPSVPYPTQVTIVADDGLGHRLNIRWQLQNYLKVFYHPPKPMKDQPTYEIVAHLHGMFTSATTGQQTVVDGTGWVDYSNNK